MPTIKNYEGQVVHFDIQTLTAKDIQSTYSDKAGFCCCGCSGKHYYAKATQKEASTGRGYEVHDEEVNDRMVTRVLRYIQSNEEEAVINEASHVAVVTGKRLYIAYFNDAFKAKHPGLCAGNETQKG